MKKDTLQSLAWIAFVLVTFFTPRPSDREQQLTRTAVIAGLTFFLPRWFRAIGAVVHGIFAVLKIYEGNLVAEDVVQIFVYIIGFSIGDRLQEAITSKEEESM